MLVVFLVYIVMVLLSFVLHMLKCILCCKLPACGSRARSGSINGGGGGGKGSGVRAAADSVLASSVVVVSVVPEPSPV